MYNRYIPNGTAYTRIAEEDAPPFPAPEHRPDIQSAPVPEPQAQPADNTPASSASKETELAEKSSGLSGLLKKLKLDDLDTGDVLLLLVLLFLFLEGDDLELIITLGLLLILGLD